MKILIVIPTYNERDNISKLIGRLMNMGAHFHVLVVDDNSPDGTGDLVEDWTKKNDRIHILRRSHKQGLGPAYIAGFQWGLARDYDIFMEMDADLSHRPRYVPKFIELIQTSDLVVGSRWMAGGRIANWPRSRVLLSRLANLYCAWVLGVKVFDMTAGFVCYQRKVLEAIALNEIHSDGYGFQIEMKCRALRKGFRIVETPITFTDRKKGSSKISKTIVWEALFLVLRLKFGMIRGLS